MKLAKAFCSLLLAGLLSCSLVLVACSSSGQGAAEGSGAGTDTSTAEEFVIGTLATEDILPYWVAENEGIFEDLGLQVSIQTFQSAQELSTAFVSGAIDMAMTDIMVSATLCASGTPVSMQWITLGAEANQGRFGIMTSPESGITSLKDLANVPIGVGSCTVPEYVMDMLMLEAGIAEDQIIGEEIKKVPVRYEMMTSNQVAAAALPGSLLALGEEQGMVCLADDLEGNNLSQSVMIVNQEFMESSSGAAMLELLAKAWDTAVNRINADPESYRSLLVEKAQLPELISQSYPISSYPTVQIPSASMVEPVLTWMEEKDYLSVSLGYDETNGCFVR